MPDTEFHSPEKPPPIQMGAAQMVDLLAKAFVVLSLISIFSGLIIRNLYLRKFGIAQFDPLRSECIATGVVWLTLSARCIVLLSNFWRWTLREWKRTTKKQKWYQVSLLPATLVGFYFFVMAMLAALDFGDGSIFGRDSWIAASVILVSAVMQTHTLALFRPQPFNYLRTYVPANPSGFIRDIFIASLFTMGLYAEAGLPEAPCHVWRR